MNRSFSNHTFRLFLLLIVSVFIFSCKNDSAAISVTNKDGTIRTEVILSAGDMLEEYNNLSIPTFFNLGVIKSENLTIPTIILSQRLSKGSKIDAYPFGAFSFTKDSTIQSYLLAMPLSENSAKPKFETFVTKHNDIINSIESWYRGQCGINRCHSFSWSSPDKLLLAIQ